MAKKRFSDGPQTTVFHLLSKRFFWLIFERSFLLVLTWVVKTCNFFLRVLRCMLHDGAGRLWPPPRSGLAL
jgi:hypothetical protein